MKSPTIIAAWISGIFVLIAAVIGGAFLLTSQQENTKPASINATNSGSGQQVVGNHNQINVQMEKAKKRAVKQLLDGTDIHLGDNIYPGSYGTSYNPLTQDIYPQPCKGVIFFDKQEMEYKSDASGVTQIGQMLVDFLLPKINNFDYSSYLHVYACNPGDVNYDKLTKEHKGKDSLIFLGPTALVANPNLNGNFYRRYSAVGYAKSFNLSSAVLNAGINPSVSDLNIEVLIKAYHGGIRKGQSENFHIILNDFSSVIPSANRAMRDPAEIRISVPVKSIHFDRPNYLFLYVLPWVESGPVYTESGKKIFPTHFRDVGIINLSVHINEV
ncbi:hypothetical protein DSLASN_22840 [Desulfoluna limicola]|uniref:Uncharacterized protein n=1 Tax=Desulfoluna limicola TaxID=2810562 RepID=A0ABM7PHT6_9BACT|nr:hypothetical protein [Desulfoluna limicola]BCS96652.1 hypothetical protein DSLASN_22840 [Desulfoluna limicola]